MFTHSIFWLWVAGLTFLAVGLAARRRELATARGLDKLIAVGPVLVASPLAVFAAEHFVAARSLAEVVPAWMPAHLFWAYFVGFALLAAAISLTARKFVGLSATLLGVMFLLFVLMLDVPFLFARPGDRLGWVLSLREIAFAGSAWALTGKRDWMILFGRFSMAIAAVFFGAQQWLHPELAPGVPDSKLTPTWVPLHAFWGYPVGAVLMVAGAALLLNRQPRIAAASVGVVMILLTVLLYLPILAFTPQPSEMTDAINYVADTLMFGGAALLVAGALRQLQ